MFDYFTSGRVKEDLPQYPVLGASILFAGAYEVYLAENLVCPEEDFSDSDQKSLDDESLDQLSTAIYVVDAILLLLFLQAAYVLYNKCQEGHDKKIIPITVMAGALAVVAVQELYVRGLCSDLQHDATPEQMTADANHDHLFYILGGTLFFSVALVIALYATHVSDVQSELDATKADKEKGETVAHVTSQPS